MSAIETITKAAHLIDMNDIIREGHPTLRAIAEEVAEQIQKSATAEKYAHYDMRFLKPLDEEMLHHIFQNYKKVITVEEGAMGGLGSAIVEFATQHNYTIPLKIIHFLMSLWG